MMLSALLKATGVLASLALFGHAQADGTAQCADDTCETQSLLQTGLAGASSQEFGPLPKPKKYRFHKRDSPLELPDIVYPMTREKASQLTHTPADSLRWFGHLQVQLSLGKGLKTFDDVLEKVWEHGAPAYYPTHPDSPQPEKGRFWQEFEQVVACQQARREKVLTETIMPVHPLFTVYTLVQTCSDSAAWVEKDYPTYFPNQQIQRFMDQGLKMDPNIFARSDCEVAVEFINKQVALSALSGWAVSTVSPGAFASKWYVGRMRPEGVAILVKSGKLNATWAIKKAIRDMHLKKAPDFTAYQPTGSPVHPAWPAMHSAASSTSTWLEIAADLTEEQRKEVRLLDFSVAYFRSLAGVHFMTDNRAGLALGQYLLKAKLPHHLAENYACSKAGYRKIKSYVSSKIRKMEKAHPLDWKTWTPEYFNPPKLH